MNLSIADSLNSLTEDGALVVPIFRDDSFDGLPDSSALDREGIRRTVERGGAKPSLYDVALLQRDGRGPATLLAGAGERDEIEPIILMRVVAAAARHLTGRGYTEIGVLDRGVTGPFELGQAATEGAIRGAYNSDFRKTKRETTRRIDRLTLVSPGARQDEVRRGAELGQIVGESNSLARDLVNMPPNELTPSSFAGRAEELAREHGLECDVLDEAAMREQGMGSLLGVAAGSREPPRLIVLRLGNPNAAVKLAVVGKGLTFDSGGLSLKPADAMDTMKCDMGGGAAVLAGLVALARLGLSSIAVTGYIGATENMPGGSAMRPGDVLTAMNGETIEVLNTDAEGRLVLADVLSYAVQQGATHIVDFATLTGGAMVALGHEATLSAGKPADWVSQVVSAAGAGLERAWPMPLYSEYRRAMDSEIADVKNTGGRWASPLTAAAFLSDFVNGVPWAHMDIAGTAWVDDASPYQPKGGTGAGVGTIVGLARQMSSQQT